MNAAPLDTAPDPDALARQAQALLAGGQPTLARQTLDNAAIGHQRAGRNDTALRCWLLAATLCRLQGQPVEASERCGRALALQGAATPALLAADLQAEIGEIALTQGRADAALAAFAAALARLDELPTGAAQTEPRRRGWLHHHARAAVAAGQAELALQDLDALQALEKQTPGRPTCFSSPSGRRMPQGGGLGGALARQAGDADAARRAAVERATVLQQLGRNAQAMQAADELEQAMAGLAAAGVVPAERQQALAADRADLHLLRCTEALRQGHGAAALAQARAAREQALAGRSAGAYIGATLAISRLSDAAADRSSAYAALATGWATLADLLGPTLARAAFAAPLQALRQAWGAAAFDTVKRDHDSRRRAAAP
jgi:hypothetical protein